MRKLLFLVLLAIMLPSFAMPIILKDQYPKIYTVKKKDTLWGISGLYLKDPWVWPQLWRCNPQFHNPHLLYPGDTLLLKKHDGNICLEIQPRVKKLSPKTRITGENPIPPIPYSVLEPFLTKSRVMQEKLFLQAPYVIAHEGKHMISTAGNTVYVRQLGAPYAAQYVVLHKDDTYIDPKTRKVLGVLARYRAQAKLEQHGDPSLLKVTEAVAEIREGDRVFPVLDRQAFLNFYPTVPNKDVNAQIIDVLRGFEKIGRYDIVAITYGRDDGAAPGQVLDVMREGRTVDDTRAHFTKRYVKLPNLKIGEMMIFRTFNKVSFALIMRAKQTIHLLDSAVTPK